MFGPNVVTKFGSDIYHTHRDKEFSDLLRRLDTTFKAKFDLKDCAVLFITGSGTLANEMVFYNLTDNVNCIYEDAKFGQRLKWLATTHGKHCRRSPNTAYVMYETSISRLNPAPEKTGFVFADMISAFPYYLPNDDIDVWTCVSGKQLGSYPGIGIIVIKDRAVDFLQANRAEGYSYLNLILHAYFGVDDMTPTTPAIPLYYDLLEKLEGFDLGRHRGKIDCRRFMLQQIVPYTATIGFPEIQKGPIFTLRKDALPLWVQIKWRLYETAEAYQLFLWTGETEDYELFIRDLERI